jgi:hypothetical protein
LSALASPRRRAFGLRFVTALSVATRTAAHTWVAGKGAKGYFAAAATRPAKKYKTRGLPFAHVGNFKFQILELWANIQIADRPS